MAVVTCPHCAATTSTDFGNCIKCGKAVLPSGVAAAAQPQASQGAQLVTGLIFMGILWGGYAWLTAEDSPEEKAAKAAEDAEQKRKGFHCLSVIDGSHREVVRLVKSQLRDPDSFEHVETLITPVDESGKHRLSMSYRARNGFGGMNVASATATIDNANCSAIVTATE